jgi:hypothetical protein
MYPLLTATADSCVSRQTSYVYLFSTAESRSKLETLRILTEVDQLPDESYAQRWTTDDGPDASI